MIVRFGTSVCLLLVFSFACIAQEEKKVEPKKTEPVELEVLKGSIGVWDVEFEVWPQGLDAKSFNFKGVETNRAFGKYWIASDLEATAMGQTNRLHSIIGYDLDEKQLVGKVIDHGKYAARMTGKYNSKTKTVSWKTEVKDANGKLMVQHTTITQTSDTERVLVLKTKAKNKNEFVKTMVAKFTKREK